MMGRSPRAPSSVVTASTSTPSVASSEDAGEGELEPEPTRRQPRSGTATSPPRGGGGEREDCQSEGRGRDCQRRTPKEATCGTLCRTRSPSRPSRTRTERGAARLSCRSRAGARTPARRAPPPGSPSGEKLNALKLRRAGSREGSLRARGWLVAVDERRGQAGAARCAGGVATPDTFARRQGSGRPPRPPRLRGGRRRAPRSSLARRPCPRARCSAGRRWAAPDPSARRRLGRARAAGLLGRKLAPQLAGGQERRAAGRPDHRGAPAVPRPRHRAAPRDSDADEGLEGEAHGPELAGAVRILLKREAHRAPSASSRPRVAPAGAGYGAGVDRCARKSRSSRWRSRGRWSGSWTRARWRTSWRFRCPAGEARGREHLAGRRGRRRRRRLRGETRRRAAHRATPARQPQGAAVRQSVSWHVERCCLNADAKTFSGSPPATLLLEKTYGARALLEEGQQDTRAMAKRALCHLPPPRRQMSGSAPSSQLPDARARGARRGGEGPAAPADARLGLMDAEEDARVVARDARRRGVGAGARRRAPVAARVRRAPDRRRRRGFGRRRKRGSGSYPRDPGDPGSRSQSATPPRPPRLTSRRCASSTTSLRPWRPA